MKDRDILIYLNSLFLNTNYLDEILSRGNLEEVLTMDERELMSIPNANKINVEKILNSRKRDYIKKLEDDINKKCTGVITILDEDYPDKLRYIENPPKILFIKGLPLNLDGIKMAFVGSRKHTSYGKYAVEKFVTDLALKNVTIISGMAAGIDALSHKFALENGAYSIGVLGTGVDLTFPSQNKSLYERMYKEGMIISEYPIGMEAKPFTFPERNRIISALSDGVVVIEAKEKSGSLITARLAAEQGREVFAVPGNINSLYSTGTNRLIRDGAIPLIDIDDILVAFPEIEMDQLSFLNNEIDLEGLEKDVFEKIKSGVDSVDKLKELLAVEMSDLNSTLVILEMKDYIKDMGPAGIKAIR